MIDFKRNPDISGYLAKTEAIVNTTCSHSASLCQPLTLPHVKNRIKDGLFFPFYASPKTGRLLHDEITRLRLACPQQVKGSGDVTNSKPPNTCRFNKSGLGSHHPQIHSPLGTCMRNAMELQRMRNSTPENSVYKKLFTSNNLRRHEDSNVENYLVIVHP